MAKSGLNENYKSPWSEPLNSPVRRREPEGHGFGGVLITIVLVVLVLAGAGVYYFYLRTSPGPNVGLEFSKPGQIMVGDPFILSVSYSNYSDQVLKDAKLSLVLPDGVSFLGQPSDQRVTEQAVGDLGPGSITPQSFKLIVIGGGNNLKHVEAKLSYATAQNSSVQFESAADIDLLVGQPAVSLSLSAPQNIFNDQDFNIKISYANNTGHDFKDVHLKADYPPIFQFKSSTMQPEGGGNNSWDLGDLGAGSNGTITVTGSVVGPEKSFLGFSGMLTSDSPDFLGQTYTLDTQAVNLAISPSPLSVQITLNSGSDNALGLGSTANYTLSYANNSDIAMQSITVTAALAGEMFDFSTLQSNAAFNSLNNTLTWFTANTPQLASLAPGQSGSVSFTIKLKESFPIRLLSDKNYTVKVQSQIQSPTVPPNTTANNTVSVAEREDKIAGKVELAAEAYWRDADSGILNSGPYPPRVNLSTDYTVHWRITNYATDVTNVTVSAYLQSGSRFTGNVKTNTDSAPTYDPNSGLVTWSVGFLPATKGVISSPAEAVFQIENTPAVNQVNQSVPLLGETNIEWTDSFIGQVFQGSALALDTSLPYDKTAATQDRTVKQ